MMAESTSWQRDSKNMENALLLAVKHQSQIDTYYLVNSLTVSTLHDTIIEWRRKSCDETGAKNYSDNNDNNDIIIIIIIFEW